MEFDFDSENNINTTKTPSIKVLNDEFKLWISDECAEMWVEIGWYPSRYQD